MRGPPECAMVLLAGGASTRMRMQKQLLVIAGKTMLRHVIDATLPASVSPYVVVLGSEARAIRPGMGDAAVQIVVNDDWKEGIASSIRCGLKAAMGLDPGIAGVIIALADQPGLDARKIEDLVQARKTTGRGIVSASFEGMLLPPVYFSAAYFPELLALKGDEGAKSILKAHPADVQPVPMENLWDIDTSDDYTAFMESRS